MRKSPGTVALILLLILVASVPAAALQQPPPAGQEEAPPFSAGKLFTFLFLTLGPFKILVPFAAITKERDNRFRRLLALKAIFVSALALIAAATVGSNTLRDWGVSAGALHLAAGIVLFLIALRPVLEQYQPKAPPEAKPPSEGAGQPSMLDLAISPLAFPAIVTPYGVAVLILVVRLRPGYLLEIAALTALVLALDFLAMLAADRILRTPYVAVGLGIVGMVMAVLQVALGIQAIVDGLRMLGVVGAAISQA